MALINCPDCNQEVSDIAPTCPKCGRPLKTAPTQRQKVSARPESTVIENILKYFLFTVLGVLVIASLGFVLFAGC